MGGDEAGINWNEKTKTGNGLELTRNMEKSTGIDWNKFGMGYEYK